MNQQQPIYFNGKGIEKVAEEIIKNMQHQPSMVIKPDTTDYKPIQFPYYPY